VTRFRDLPTAILGRIGEEVAARELRRDGFGVIASFKFSGNDSEAPAIEFDACREIVPDLDVCQRGDRFWIEVKTYKTWWPNHVHRIDVHGVLVRHYDNYVAVERRTGSKVFLAINELRSGYLIVSDVPLSQMERYACLCGCKSNPSLHRPSIRNPRAQWYFNRADFTSRYRFDTKTIDLLRSEHKRLIPAPTSKRNLPPQLRLDERVTRWGKG
jgi:hypothetical protein